MNVKTLSAEIDANSVSIDEELVFNEVSLKNWRQELYLEISEDLDYKDLIKLNTKLDELYSISKNNYSMANNSLILAKRSLQHSEAEEYINISRTEGPRKSQATIEKEIIVNLESKLDTVSILECLVDFWEEQKNILEKKSKLLDNIFWALKNEFGAA